MTLWTARIRAARKEVEDSLDAWNPNLYFRALDKLRHLELNPPRSIHRVMRGEGP